MEKYKNAEYYRTIIDNRRDSGLNFSQIALYLNKKGIKRFDSGLEYSRMWITKHIKEDIFDPHIFDAIIYLSKKKDINSYIEQKIKSKTDFLYARATRSALQKHLNNRD